MSFGPIYIDHIGIATKQLDENSSFWRLIGLTQGDHDETVEDQGSPHGSSQLHCIMEMHQVLK